MKTTFYIAIVMVISFIAIIPDKPKDYPPQNVVEQRESIGFKESKIDNLMRKIQHEQTVDSIQLNIIRNEQSKAN